MQVEPPGTACLLIRRIFLSLITGQPIGDTHRDCRLDKIRSRPETAAADFAISANALDALLFPGLGQVAGVAPSMFGLAGVFTNPQFQVVIRALNQKKGIDLLSAPSVTTKSGQRAIIEVSQRISLSEDIYSATGSIDQQQHWKLLSLEVRQPFLLL